MSKQTQNLINKYNRSVDSIRQQELAIDKVKNKLDALKSGEVVPPSLREISTQLSKSEKDLDKVIAKLEKMKQIEVTTLAEDKTIAELEQTKVNIEQVIAELKDELQSGLSDSVEVQQLTTQLDILQSKLQQTKDEANQTGNAIKTNLKTEETNNLNANVESIKNKFDEAGDKATSLGNKLVKTLGKNGVGKQFDNLTNKVQTFGKRITKLISAVAVFNLIRRGLTSLRNGFMSILKSNDSFNQSLAQIKGNLMTAFAPIYNAVLPAINSLMSGLVKVTGTIAQFISGLFGIKTNKAVNQAKKLTNALNETSDSAGRLASFDKLEVIGDTGGSSGGGGDYNYSAVESVNSKLLETLNKIKELISSGDWSTLFNMLSTGLINVVNNIALYISQINWGAIAYGITGAIMGIDWLGLGLSILSLITSVFSGIYELFIGIDWAGIGVKFYEVFHGLLNRIILLFTQTDWKTIGSNVANSILDFILNVDWLQLGSDIIVGIITGIAAFNELVVSFFATMVTRILDYIGGSKFVQYGKELITGLWNGMKNVANKPVEIFKSIYTKIKNVFKDIKKYFSGIWDSIKSVFSTIGTKIGNAFKSAFESVINSVLKAAESAINAPIKGINSAIGTINKLPGVEIKKMSTIKFPRLAEGAVIPPRQEFMAILGDQKHGTNIEAPLDTIKQANREVLQEMFDNLPTGNGSGEVVIENLTIVNKMGDQEISRTVVKGVRIAEKQYGKPLFIS